MNDRPRAWFLVPGDLATPTGGYRYDRRMISGLRALGWHVEHRALGGDFPSPGAASRRAARALIASIPEGETVVVDGLALGVLPEIAEQEHQRLRLIGLVHHPLCMEGGLDAERATELEASEARALRGTRGVLVTSATTAESVSRLGVAHERIRVVVPGTDPAPPAEGSGGGRLHLLCVATLTRRKGHDLLLRALARLADWPWRLTCVGCTERDQEWTAALYGLRDRLGLRERVRFTGALAEADLERCYVGADLFVLPSRFEGYGMACAEALARGLPIVATTGGALAETLPGDAALLVPPDCPAALTAALRRLFEHPDLRRRLADRARAAGQGLPTWEQSARVFAAAITELSGG